MSRFHEELYRQKGQKHDDLVIKCVSDEGINEILVHSGAEKAVLDWGRKEEIPNIYTKYETEVICRQGPHGFILGYADLMIKLCVNRKEGYGEFEEILSLLVAQILVECKPSLADIGSTVRQLKTYESVLRQRANFYKVIATYSTPSKQVIDYLQHEGIMVVVFKEGA